MNPIKKLAVVIVALGSVSAAQADPILVTSNDGSLLGAQHIEVEGSFFDVLFVDGTCMSVFDGCGASSDFFFNTQSDSLAASQALLDHVFLDRSDGNFDSNPALTVGCSVREACLVLTPYRFTPEVNYATSASNHDDEYNDRTEKPGLAASSDTSDSSTFVWAVWSSPVSVPEPGTLTLFGIGLLGMGLARRRKQQA